MRGAVGIIIIIIIIIMIITIIIIIIVIHPSTTIRDPCSQNLPQCPPR